MRKIHPFNNKHLRLSPFKLDAIILELMRRKAHWCAYIYPYHRNKSSNAIDYSVSVTERISRNLRDTKISRIFHNTKLLKFLIPPLTKYSNIFVGHKLNQVSFKFINLFKEIYASIAITRKSGVFHLTGAHKISNK